MVAVTPSNVAIGVDPRGDSGCFPLQVICPPSDSHVILNSAPSADPDCCVKTVCQCANGEYYPLSICPLTLSRFGHVMGDSLTSGEQAGFIFRIISKAAVSHLGAFLPKAKVVFRGFVAIDRQLI